jgi:beta-glucosidase
MIKKKYIWLVAAVSFVMLFSCGKNKQESVVDQGDEDIEQIISTMTLEEKVGQMTNLTLSTIAEEVDDTIKVDTAKLNEVIIKRHVGSIQNVLTHAYHLDEWHEIIEPIQKLTLEKTRHKIPFLYCIDAVHGANFIYGATLFPHNLGLAATRNPLLAEQCGAVTAVQVRAAGIRYNFSPVLDVGRNQQWSRFGETFGEDVYLVTQMGVAAIHGYEGKDVSSYNNVAACMKHFVGYSVPQNGKDRAPANIPEIVLREYFLPSFREAVKAGTQTLMVNSAEVNGTPVHASKYLLTDVLRNELGFKGVIISDWQDILKLHERHRVAATHKDAVYLAVNAGIDMCIVPFDFSFTDDLLALVKEGKISEERINESVRRILKLKKNLGLFKNPYLEKESVALFSKPEYTETALQAALESITLLKNEKSILPLSDNQRVFLTGPSANSLSALHGAWSYAWQGNKEKLYPDSLKTIADLFAQHTGNKYMESVSFDSSDYNVSAILKASSNADVILLCLGEPAYAETPGNIPDLAFDPKQVELVKTLAKTGKPIVLVLLEGRPRIIREIEPYCSAIVLAYWPGSQGAQAIHDVVYGKFNPSGKLPFTYPRYSGSLITYDHKLLDEAVEIVEPEYKYFFEFKPQYEFGHGLSYTTFKYSPVILNTDTLFGSDSLNISITVTNTGKLDGQEVVELFSRDMYASVTPSVKRLRRFVKIYLKAEESKKVEFVLHKKDLGFVTEDKQTITEEGEFEILIADQKASFYYKP